VEGGDGAEGEGCDGGGGSGGGSDHGRSGVSGGTGGGDIGGSSSGGDGSGSGSTGCSGESVNQVEVQRPHERRGSDACVDMLASDENNDCYDEMGDIGGTLDLDL